MTVALCCVRQSDISLNKQRVDTRFHQCVHGSLMPCSTISFRHRRLRVESVGNMAYGYICAAQDPERALKMPGLGFTPRMLENEIEARIE